MMPHRSRQVSGIAPVRWIGRALGQREVGEDAHGADLTICRQR